MPEDDLLTRYILVMNLGLSHLATGDTERAIQLLEQALRYSESTGNRLAAREAIGTLAEVQEVQGQLHRAAGTYHEILRLVAAGRSNHEIAAELVIATGTVRKHLSNIFGKLGVKSRTQCAAKARELNLL